MNLKIDKEMRRPGREQRRRKEKLSG